MPRTVQIKLYSYEELSPEAQKAARDEWVEEDRSHGSHDACAQVHEDFEQVVGDAGYPTKDIRWSRTWTVVCWTACRQTTARWLRS
jgi:hypothetical protein